MPSGHTESALLFSRNTDRSAFHNIQGERNFLCQADGLDDNAQSLRYSPHLADNLAHIPPVYLQPKDESIAVRDGGYDYLVFVVDDETHNTSEEFCNPCYLLKNPITMSGESGEPVQTSIVVRFVKPGEEL